MVDDLITERKKGTTLKQIVEDSVQENQPSEIPWIIRVLENPESPVALPGKISLENHDYIHALLDCGTTLPEEALVIGFTMGSNVKTNRFHLTIFKFFSRFLYPEKYRFNEDHLKLFELGFCYGRKPYITDNINEVDFSMHKHTEITELREFFGVKTDELTFLKKSLEWLMGYDIQGFTAGNHYLDSATPSLDLR